MELLKRKSITSYSYLMEHGAKVEDLDARYDSRKSFYGKAKIYELDGILYLVSYETIVAKIHENYAQIFGYYSQTTWRHINEFLYQHDFYKMSKKDFDKLDYSETHGAIIKRGVCYG